MALQKAARQPRAGPRAGAARSPAPSRSDTTGGGGTRGLPSRCASGSRRAEWDDLADDLRLPAERLLDVAAHAAARPAASPWARAGTRPCATRGNPQPEVPVLDVHLPALVECARRLEHVAADHDGQGVDVVVGVEQLAEHGRGRRRRASTAPSAEGLRAAGASGRGVEQRRLGVGAEVRDLRLQLLGQPRRRRRRGRRSAGRRRPDARVPGAPPVRRWPADQADRHGRTPRRRPRVPSVDPSSTTMTSKSRKV